jgi:DNA-binding response OmpR family regulator
MFSASAALYGTGDDGVNTLQALRDYTSITGAYNAYMQRILAVDDEPNILEVITQRLERDGFEVRCAPDGETALELLESEEFAGAVLDIGLPGMDGFDVLRALRAQGQALPVIMLTARGDEIDRVVGLELGADDYLVKPFSPRELVARLRALLRRTAEAVALRARLASQEPKASSTSTLAIDSIRRVASFHGVQLDLRPREFDLLATLAAHPEQVWSREALLRRVWGNDEHIDARTVDVHIRRLRAKLMEIDPDDQPLQTEWGVGYRFRQ